MHIYFAGAGGMAIGPLAQIAAQAGHTVAASDRQASDMTAQLEKAGIPVTIGNGEELTALHAKKPIDWIVVTAAITGDHPILVFAKKHDIKVTKRDALIDKVILSGKHQKLLAISGTHGKTTTAGMLIWLFKQFDIPVSYSVGTLLGFGPSGHFAEDAEYFVYEADEYDRNMLHFKPDISLLTSVDYDHPDTYPTVADYQQAFRDFIAQSRHTYLWQKDADYLHITPGKRINTVDHLLTRAEHITLAGEHTRRNALLAAACFDDLCDELGFDQIAAALNHFPGTWRRFEKLADNVYTTYAHHPTEIAANIQMAQELAKKVVVVYQPHQNIRQHRLLKEYKDCFAGAEQVYWLPTYLTREDPNLAVIKPAEFIAKLTAPKHVEAADMNEALLKNLKHAHKDGALVLVMGAGDVDGWLRQKLSQIAK